MKTKLILKIGREEYLLDDSVTMEQATLVLSILFAGLRSVDEVYSSKSSRFDRVASDDITDVGLRVTCAAPTLRSDYDRARLEEACAS